MPLAGTATRSSRSVATERTTTEAARQRSSCGALTTARNIAGECTWSRAWRRTRNDVAPPGRPPAARRTRRRAKKVARITGLSRGQAARAAVVVAAQDNLHRGARLLQVHPDVPIEAGAGVAAA